MTFSPETVMGMWAAGVAGTGALVVYWKVVGGGYTVLVAATVVLLGGGAWFFDPTPLTAVAALLGVGAALMSRSPGQAGAALAVSSLLFLAHASADSRLLPALTGSLALGGITAEMVLGHWYLIDPRMPRRPLRALGVIGGTGVALDAALHLIPGISASSTAIIVSVGLFLTTLVLMMAVWFCLGYPSYPGVMAATGLSYLAVLTGLGSVILIRALASGAAPFG
ncbi:MAG: hypothetical protein OXG89_03605 [bacterium]|nr:hypothetical protein [bacterium]MCY3652098.1 hypothetical protein [bacterium]